MPSLKEKCDQRDSNKDPNNKQKIGLVIQGDVLSLIMSIPDLKEEFTNVADRLDIVLACRVAPKQKADIVNLVKEKHPSKTMLAIGDGANDVSMIQAANVGIGIIGKEGQQAARASDFAFG